MLNRTGGSFNTMATCSVPKTGYSPKTLICTDQRGECTVLRLSRTILTTLAAPPSWKHQDSASKRDRAAVILNTRHNYQARTLENDELWWPTSCRIRFLHCVTKSQPVTHQQCRIRVRREKLVEWFITDKKKEMESVSHGSKRIHPDIFTYDSWFYHNTLSQAVCHCSLA